MDFWPIVVWLVNAIAVLVLVGIAAGLAFLILGTLGGAIINLARRRSIRADRETDEQR